jgi:hypothetical protein
MRGKIILSLVFACASLASAQSYNALFQGDSDQVVRVINTRTSTGGTAIGARSVGNGGGVGLDAHASAIGVHSYATYGTPDVKRAYYGRVANASSAGFGAYLDAYDGEESYGVAGLSWGGSSSSYGLYGIGQGNNGMGVYGSGSTWAGYFSGDVMVTGTFYNPSDVSIKKNVRTLESGLGKVMALKPKSYEMEADKFSNVKLSKGAKYGLIAQDVEAVMPELVKAFTAPAMLSKDGPKARVGKPVNLKSVDYIALIPIMVKAMQEQQATIQSLQAEVASLKSK